MTTTETAVLDSLDFFLDYDGPALQAHEMNVRDLAPAILSAADLLQSVNRQVFPTNREVQVNVRATDTGSFLIHLKILWDQTMAVLENPELEASEGLAGLLSAVAVLINYLIKRGRSGPPQEQPIENGMIRVTWPDGTVMEIPANVLRQHENPQVRRPLGDMARPLSREGIESVVLRQGDDVLAEVTKDDLSAVRWTGRYENQELLNVSEVPIILTIRSVPLDGSLTWRFSDGHNSYACYVTDEGFNERMSAGKERFGAGDLLRCLLRSEQWRDPQGGLHTEHEIVRVLEHIEPPQPEPPLF